MKSAASRIRRSSCWRVAGLTQSIRSAFWRSARSSAQASRTRAIRWPRSSGSGRAAREPGRSPAGDGRPDRRAGAGCPRRRARRASRRRSPGPRRARWRVASVGRVAGVGRVARTRHRGLHVVGRDDDRQHPGAPIAVEPDRAGLAAVEHQPAVLVEADLAVSPGEMRRALQHRAEHQRRRHRGRRNAIVVGPVRMHIHLFGQIFARSRRSPASAAGACGWCRSACRRAGQRLPSAPSATAAAPRRTPRGPSR